MSIKEEVQKWCEDVGGKFDEGDESFACSFGNIGQLVVDKDGDGARVDGSDDPRIQSRGIDPQRVLLRQETRRHPEEVGIGSKFNSDKDSIRKVDGVNIDDGVLKLVGTGGVEKLMVDVDLDRPDNQEDYEIRRRFGDSSDDEIISIYNSIREGESERHADEFVDDLERNGIDVPDEIR